MAEQEEQSSALEPKLLAYFEGRGLTKVAAAFASELEDRNIHSVNDLEDKWEEYQAKKRDETSE